LRAFVKSALAVTAVGALSAALLPGPAAAGPASSSVPGSRDSGRSHDPGIRPDNLPNPIAEKQLALRDKAINLVIRGKREVQKNGPSGVVKLADGQYAEVSREATDADPDQVLTFLVEFGNRHKDGTPMARPGPLHNNIPRPDRKWDGSSTDDNSTYWRKNFNRGYYMDLLFGDKNSMAHFYKKQSSGNYALAGDVSPWVKLPYRESRYGYNRDQADGYWNYVKDSARSWYRAKINQGWSEAKITNYLSDFDKWDRYDADGDGDFNESDGYIDHFQAIHAGEGEESGGVPPWAIWSHRWYAFPTLFGQAGPQGAKFGGVKIGKSGFWIGDYTTEPENGGLGVFAHEYGHDLGLADYYDTAGGDNGTGFWTIMSAGSWLNKGGNSIGTKPGYMGIHEKLLLGWLDYEYIPYAPGSRQRVSLGPAEVQGRHAQGLVVGLPQTSQTVEYNTPHSGNWEWWGGSADNLNTTLTHEGWDLTGTTNAEFTAWAWYDIEEGYDYLYGEVSVNGGAWQNVPESNHPDTGIDGSTTEWEQISYDLSPYAGESDVRFRFRYQTDTGVHYAGPFLDDFQLVEDGNVTYSDDVEAGTDGWTADGTWQRTTGTETETASQYYLAENRRYIGYDRTLRTGPYNFGWAYTRPNWVERFPYQDGLLIWYWNNLYEDNNTSVHPGYGWALPVDSRPTPITFNDGSLLGNRRQPFDATFGRSVTNPVTFHREAVDRKGNPYMMREHLGVRRQLSVFDDSRKNEYWSKRNPWGSTKVAGSDTQIRVLYETSDGRRTDLRVVFE